MKKHLAAFAALAVASGLFAQENLIPNGGFENVVKKAKGTDKYLIGQIRNGWDLGTGPIATLPKDWLLNGGKGKLRVITVGENGENKENVHSGKHALYFEEMDGHIASGCNVKPGKYELSFWYKGTGKIGFVSYLYGVNPTTGKIGRHITSRSLCNITVNSPDEWKQHKVIVEIGKGIPDVKQGSIAHYSSKGGYYIDDIVLMEVKNEESK